jgi:hypothetical protein
MNVRAIYLFFTNPSLYDDDDDDDVYSIKMNSMAMGYKIYLHTNTEPARTA